MDKEVDENYEAYMADVGRDNLAKVEYDGYTIRAKPPEKKQIPKPPIVEVKRITKSRKDLFPHGHKDCKECEDFVKTAQRDADAEYYEGKYGKELDELKVQISDLNKRISGFREQVRAGVLKVIEDEPEFPGNMPDEVWEAIQKAIENNNTREVIQDIMRNVVKMTKSEIIKRLSGTMPDEVKRNTPADPEPGVE